VQDPAAQVLPSECLLLPPLHCLHKANVRNQEPPQPGESRPVLAWSQRVLSRHMMRNYEPWIINIRKSNNNRIVHQLVFHTQKIIPTTSIQDLNPRPCVDNTNVSDLPFEMEAIEPGDGEIPTRKLTWKPLGWLSHIKSRTIDDLFPLELWIHTLMNLWKSVDPQVHECVSYKLDSLLDSVGHKVKIHKITSATGKERGDIEIRDYVVLQKLQEQDNRLSPTHTLILDFAMTYTRSG
jgi:hypothetical protein